MRGDLVPTSPVTGSPGAPFFFIIVGPLLPPYCVFPVSPLLNQFDLIFLQTLLEADAITAGFISSSLDLGSSETFGLERVDLLNKFQKLWIPPDYCFFFGWTSAWKALFTKLYKGLNKFNILQAISKGSLEYFLENLPGIEDLLCLCSPDQGRRRRSSLQFNRKRRLRRELELYCVDG